MAFRLYVGNYPQEFTRKDVQDLFKEFDGVQVDKVFHLRDSSKRFSFLNCENIDQVLSVIKTKNGTKVYGRNLVVRASDHNLQEYVNFLLENDENSSLEEPFVQTSPPKVPSVKTSPPEVPSVQTSPSDVPFVPMQIMRNKRPPHQKKDNSEKSDSNKMKSESFPTKSQANIPISENGSARSLGSKYNNYQQKHDRNLSESLDSNLQFFSKPENKLNQQTNFRNYAGSPLNGCQTDKHEYETNVNHFSKPENRLNEQTNFRNYVGSPLNGCQTDKHEYETNVNHFSKPEKKLNEQSNFRNYFGNPSNGRQTDKHEYAKNVNHSSKSFDESFSRKPINDVFENASLKSPKYYQPKNDCVQIKTNRNSFSERSPPHSNQEMSEKNSNSYSSSPYSFNGDHNEGSDINGKISRNKTPPRYRDTNSHTWVSVTNFRLGTCAGYLFDLFSDYHPIEVQMICNEPRYDKTLTEAHVCFPSRDIADDVIMNFDNTILHGRVILVNDVEDLTILNELLNVSQS